MKRRVLLGTIGLVMGGLAGCVATDTRESAGDTKSPLDSGTDATVTASDAFLQVSIEGHIPDDVEPVDAEEAGLTENEYIADGLEEASDAYEDGMEADLDPNDNIILAMVVESELTGVEETLGNNALYVNYDGVTYHLLYHEITVRSE